MITYSHEPIKYLESQILTAMGHLTRKTLLFVIFEFSNILCNVLVFTQTVNTGRSNNRNTLINNLKGGVADLLKRLWAQIEAQTISKSF